MFCSHCGKEIPEESVFCLACGRAIAGQTKSESAAERWGKRIVAVLGWGAITTAMVLLVYFVANKSFLPPGRSSALSTASLLRPFSDSLFRGSLGINASATRYKTFTVGTTFVKPRVTGTFKASGGSGNDIHVIVAEWGECENWMNGHNAQVLYSSGKTTNGRLDVAISEPGQYCVAFSNKFSLISSKTVRTDVELKYLTR